MPKGKAEQVPDARLLELFGDVCGLLDMEEFHHGLLEALHRVLPSEYVSLNDVGPQPEDVVAIIDPDRWPELHDRWAAHAHENPILRRYQKTLDGRAYRFSDVISHKELHGLALYREVYAPIGVEYQMAFCLPGSPNRVLAIALSRERSDYSDAERDFANRARPFLIQAYLNALAYGEQRARRAEPRTTPPLEPLLQAGLTRREAEVLRLVALGGSNNHVAAELCISARTVGKHLEHGFRKLGVADRSTAAQRVWQLAGGDGEGSGPVMGERGDGLRRSREGVLAAQALERSRLAGQEAEHEGDEGER
jgi:DNA-binding CsgD family transcriptional regulator